MIRKFGFGLVLVTAFIVVACGRQVTPNPIGSGPGGLPPGYMSVKFDVNGTFNFSAYNYFVIFNTTHNGITPLTNPQQNNWAAYSYALQVGGNANGTFANAAEFLRTSGINAPPAYLSLGATPQQFQYIPNSNGSGTEFTIVFQRSIFNGLNASPGPSASPGSSPTPAPVTNIWLFNAFTTQANAQNQFVFVDSMGAGGATDTSFVSPQLNVQTAFDQVFTKLQDNNPPTDPAAQIYSIEIANNP